MQVSRATVGSSTVCLVALNGSLLDSLNLGDSGFVVIRNKKILYESEIQEHDKNAPYQLSGPRSQEVTNCISDLPEAGYRHSIEVAPGDLVVLYTDGVSDNLGPEELLQLASGQAIPDIKISDGLKDQFQKHLLGAVDQARQLEGLAEVIALSAHCAGLHSRTSRKGRFSRGKLDDVTVVVGKVVEQ